MTTVAGLHAVVVGTLLVVSLTGCDIVPARAKTEKPGDPAPTQAAAFRTLYDRQCAGCHGRDGRLGAARPLNDPVYLAVVPADRLRAPPDDERLRLLVGLRQRG